MNRNNTDNVGGGTAVVHRGGNSSLSINMKSSLPLPPPPSPPSPRRRKSNHTMASNQKKKFLHQTRVDMAGNLEHVPSSEEDEYTSLHQHSSPTIERTNCRIDSPHSPSSPSASLSKLSSVEVRLAKLLKEHPNNERALLLQKKINDRKAQATKRQQKVQNHLDVHDPYKSAESLGSMTRLDIHGLYFKDGKGGEPNGGTSTSSSSSSSPPPSPSAQRKPPIQTVSKLSPTTSRNEVGNNQSILRSGRYNSTTDDGNKTALLGLIDSIEQKYNSNNDPSSPIQKQRTKQPKKSKSWAGTNTDTVERGRNNQQHDGPDGRSRSRSKRARSTSRSRKSRSKSKTRSRSKSASRKKKGEPATDDKRNNTTTNNNNSPKYRRSRSLPPGPVDDVHDDLPRAASFHQPRYPPPSSSSITSRNSNGSYITDTRSVGADGSSSYYDGYDDSTVGSFHQHRRLQPKTWRLPLSSSSSSPPERLQSYKTATWMLVVCLLIVGLVILILWIVGVIEI